MPHVIEKTVFNFDELSYSAKETARDWYRNDGGDSFMFAAEHVLEDAATVGDLLGIDLRQKRVQLMGGGHRYEPHVYFDCDRGDISISASYRYKKGALKAVMEYAPQDEELHGIAVRLQAAQKKYFYKLVANCGHNSRGNNTVVEVEYTDDPYREIDSDLEETLRDFASWILGNLRKELEYVYSDEVVDESIRANEYEFDEDGNLA